MSRRKRGFWDRKLREDPSFRRELEKWDKKLKKSGFVDIEQRLECRGQEAMYLTGSPSSGDLNRRLYKASTEEYYRLARKHFWTLPYGGDRAVWKLHMDGVSIPKIVEKLRKRYGYGTKRVAGIIRRQKAKMMERANAELDEA